RPGATYLYIIDFLHKADSISLLKIQNLLHGYERLIEHEKGRYTQLLGKVRKLENEKKGLQAVLEETRELKSMPGQIQPRKFTLKQEEEKRMSTEMLYEKNRELLRKKEDQYCKEMEEKQQFELTQRSLEMELRTLRNHLKQVEEERNETQRQLSQEQSTRALQEGILNNHLWRQKEIEEETKITAAKSSEVSSVLSRSSKITQLEIENARLEATTKQQTSRIEVLQKDLQDSASTDELSKKLDIESKKSTQLESTNRDLREQLSSMKILHKNHEKLEKSKWQLEEEVTNLKRQVETNMMDHSQIEQYKREIEERARQEIRQKLEEVNLFLQTQAASQETLEQIRTTNNASLRNQLEHRIRDLESELARIKNTQEDRVFQKQSTQTELERYKELYLEELKIRKSLASKLDSVPMGASLQVRKLPSVLSQLPQPDMEFSLSVLCLPRILAEFILLSLFSLVNLLVVVQ
uniref:CCDC144C-like coiled-coil domain-containing protein n=1 Tax=Chelydra serpentina TaxID=8475 RepID=A0A8C3T8X7_CHESE